MAVVLLLAAACGSPAPETRVVPPDTPAGAQLGWLVAAMADLPMSEAQVRAHFNPGFLGLVGPAELNHWLQGGEGARLVWAKAVGPSTVDAIVSAGATRARLWLTVDSRTLIADLGTGPVIPEPPVPATWAGVDAALHSAAPQVRLLVAEVSNGSCRPVNGIDPATPGRIGSVFKLWVLHALGSAVAAGKVGWDRPLTVTAQHSSLPSGVLQYEPDGTQVSVRETAAKMISISDNTAADMLINLVGRPAVEAALTTTAMTNPALDRPFLTTREMSIIMLEPALERRYLAANEAGRRALVTDTVDRLPLPAVRSAIATLMSRGLTSLDYFASANDICRAYASLAALTRRPGLSPIGQVLSINDGGLGLDPAQWKTTWFKGGYEPRAITWAYLATTRTGHSYVVTVLAENPSQPIDAKAGPTILSAIKGAFALTAGR